MVERQPSVAPEEVPLRDMRRSRMARRVMGALLVVYVAAGASGFFGVKTAQVTASADGYELTVRYAAVTRPALASPWSIEVTREGGFDGPIVIGTTLAYFTLFDENGLNPDPASATTSGDLLVWEFDPPTGDRLIIDFDARIGPDVQWGKAARTVVLDDADREIVSVSYRTRVMP